ncbi:MAG: DUF2490 domain-containing protein [Nitrospira sp.]|nr:DUF2490 domain-containing protein [Nitrospira sp.]
MEERWIEHADGTAVRFRQMFRADFPIPQAPDWAFVVYDEIFINLNTVGVPTARAQGQESIRTVSFSALTNRLINTSMWIWATRTRCSTAGTCPAMRTSSTTSFSCSFSSICRQIRRSAIGEGFSEALASDQ